MKMNAGIWIGIIGGIIGLAVGIIAVISTTTGSMGLIIAAAMLLIFGGMFYLFYRLIFKGMINVSRLQKTGIPGKATIVEVRDTGITINNNPQAKLILEIKNSFGQRYQAETRVIVSRLNPGAYQPGMEVPVKIDPKNEKNVVLDFSGRTGSTVAGQDFYSTQEMGNLKNELEQMQKETAPMRDLKNNIKSVQ